MALTLDTQDTCSLIPSPAGTFGEHAFSDLSSQMIKKDCCFRPHHRCTEGKSIKGEGRGSLARTSRVLSSRRSITYSEDLLFNTSEKQRFSNSEQTDTVWNPPPNSNHTSSVIRSGGFSNGDCEALLESKITSTKAASQEVFTGCWIILRQTAGGLSSQCLTQTVAEREHEV